MKRRSKAASATRHAFTAGIAALALATGATWLMAGDRLASGNLQPAMRLAQAPSAPALVAQATKSPFDSSQKAAIESIVKEYLLNNPEVMLEIQTALEGKMEKLQAEKLKSALKDNAAQIFRSAGAPVAGNPNGDIPIVEFFDYNCGYCKRAFGDVAKAVEQDPKIKLILNELPILSKGSEEGARVALAAGLQGKYWDAHRALIAIRGEVNQASALKAVEKIAALDQAKLKKDLTSDAVNAEIKRVRDLAQKMGIQGTPHFLIGDRAIPGAPGNLLEQIQTHVTDLRKSGCTVC